MLRATPAVAFELCDRFSGCTVVGECLAADLNVNLGLLQFSPYNACTAPRQHVKKLASKAFDTPDSSASAAPAMHRPSRTGSHYANSARVGAATRRSRITDSQSQNLAGKAVRDARGAVCAMPVLFPFSAPLFLSSSLLMASRLALPMAATGQTTARGLKGVQTRLFRLRR